jgi:hypothetical protein
MHNIYLQLTFCQSKTIYVFKVNILETYIYAQQSNHVQTARAHTATQCAKMCQKSLFFNIFLSRTKMDKDKLITVLGG